MFGHQTLNQQQIGTKSPIKTINEASAIANNERNEAVWKVVGGWIQKIKSISGKGIGFGLKLAG